VRSWPDLIEAMMRHLENGFCTRHFRNVGVKSEYSVRPVTEEVNVGYRSVAKITSTCLFSQCMKMSKNEVLAFEILLYTLFFEYVPP
jgi:hypothetical protein